MRKSLKILHTADWHLGLVSWKGFKGVDRLEEQRDCLQEMLKVLQEEKVNLVLHAGDLFHQYHNPPREAIRLATETLIEMSSKAQVVWVMGNHDWYAIEALQDIFPASIVISKNFQPLVFENLGVCIYPLPYLSLSRYLGKYTGKSIHEEVKELLAEVFRGWEKHYRPEYWHILVAHCTLEELAFYNEANLAREIFLKAAELPRGIDYGAFGHLHSFIPFEKASFPIYYPSSLICDTFQREGEKGGFLTVELKEGQKPNIRLYHFNSCAQLFSILLDSPEKINNLEEKITKQLQGKRNYIRLKIKEELRTPELISRLRNLEGENWQIVTLEVVSQKTEVEEPIEKPREITKYAILELFKEFCRINQLPGELEKLFENYYHQALEEVEKNATG